MVGASDSVGCFSENEDQEYLDKMGAEAEISKSWSNSHGNRFRIHQNIFREFDTPGSSKNIKIIDQFEIRDTNSSNRKEHLQSKFSSENNRYSAGADDLGDSLSLVHSTNQKNREFF